MSIYKKIIATMLLGALYATSANAFDDKKEGLIIGLGAGISLSSTDFSSAYSGWSTGRADAELGVATSFKLGYGFNENYTLYYFRNSAFVHGYSKDPNERTYGNCVTGLGMNYYMDDSDFYVLAGLGVGQLSKLADSERHAQRGFGAIAGVGYEYADHVQLEINYLATRVDDDIKLSTDALQFTLNYYFY